MAETLDDQAVLQAVSVDADDAGISDSESYNFDEALIYDIYFKKDGERIQPNGEMTVYIPVPDTMDVGICRVLYIDKEGSFVDMNAVYQNGYMVFTTDHFSYYAVVEKKASIIGDVDRDGEITASDVTALSRYVAGWGEGYELADMDAADVDCDGEITASDVTLFSRYVAGWGEGYEIGPKA